MQVIDVIVVPTTKNVKLVVIYGSCVTPSRARHLAKASHSEVESGADNLAIGAFRPYESAQVKDVDVIQVDILTMAASE